MIDPGYDQPKTALTPKQVVWQLEIALSDLSPAESKERKKVTKIHTQEESIM